MKKIFLSFIGAICLLQAYSQKCPTITVNTSSSQVPAGSYAMFTADTKGLPGNITPTYNWSVSSGVISSGQGTSSITVELNDAGSCTATVDIGGLPRECTSYSSTTVIVSKAPDKILSATYTNMAALDKLVQQYIAKTHLKDHKIMQTGMIIIHPGSTTSAATLKAIHTGLDASFKKYGVYTYQYQVTDADDERKQTEIEMFMEKD